MSKLEQPILANEDVAVMTKLNDLAERHGLKPYDFVAILRRENDDGVHRVDFVVQLADVDFHIGDIRAYVLDIRFQSDDSFFHVALRFEH